MRVRPLAAAALVTGALLSSPAGATTTCVGEHSILYACVVTPTVGVGTTEFCFYLASSSCTPVSVPTPTVGGEVDAYCGGALNACRITEFTVCDVVVCDP